MLKQDIVILVLSLYLWIAMMSLFYGITHNFWIALGIGMLTAFTAATVMCYLGTL